MNTYKFIDYSTVKLLKIKEFKKINTSENLESCRKKEETLTEKMKRSPDERHTQTHGSLIETFQQLQMSFMIKRALF